MKNQETPSVATETTKQAPDPTMVVKKMGDTYVLEGAPFCNHRRHKNYAARIDGLDPKWGFARKFFERGEDVYIFPEKPIAGQIIEVQAIYYTGSGRPEEWDEGRNGFYQLQKNGRFAKISKELVKTSFQEQEIDETF